jgi:hypothetical protein
MTSKIITGCKACKLLVFQKGVALLFVMLRNEATDYCIKGIFIYGNASCNMLIRITERKSV